MLLEHLFCDQMGEIVQIDVILTGAIGLFLDLLLLLLLHLLERHIAAPIA